MGKPKRECIGQKFGRLTVLSEIPIEERTIKKRQLLCKCDCGKIVKVQAGNLFSGNTSSCGCYEAELTQKRTRISEVGKRFGRLVVLSEDDYSNGVRNRMAICQCDCGKVVTKRINDLRSGMTRSCGCLKTETMKKLWTDDLTGKTFGELTAIRQVENHIGSTGRESVRWLWKCSCGREIVAMATNVKRGFTKSCGHLGKSQAEFEMFKFLQDNNVNFSYNACPFDDFRNPMTGYKLYVDFCFIKPNGEYIFVEHQGVQHYYDDKYNNEFGYEQRKFTDKIKREYCERNGIKLYETRYDEDYIAHLAQILKENGLLKEEVA